MAIALFTTCAGNGHKIGEIYVNSEKVTCIVPYETPNNSMSMCHLTIEGLANPVMIKSSAAYAAKQLGYSIVDAR